ncbi:MAG: hypothetical protein IVW57_09920 [Ktedonobacterales bacterium]|nr:hypothetical protein [Ktedonobacterales bacterium]MBF6590830.1 hypothetical protein [Ktedonobacterales bacterium]
MAESDDLIAHYQGLHPLRFTELERFDLEQHADSSVEQATLKLTILLGARKGGPREKLLLQFTGIEQLRFESGGYMQLPQLDIQPIHDRQWDRLHYHIREVEEDKLSFYCHTFKVALIKEANSGEA